MHALGRTSFRDAPDDLVDTLVGSEAESIAITTSFVKFAGSVEVAHSAEATSSAEC